tara:strand:- start:748 stop:1008 length:261 start_codon:yes stop_codon:yes gene_type:complete
MIVFPVKVRAYQLICLVAVVKDLEKRVNNMDEELRNFVEEKWGLYESALAKKDATLGRHQHTMAFIRTLANVLALGMSIVIAYKVW